MKRIIFLLLFILPRIADAQLHAELKAIQPDQEFDNVYVKKIAEDSLQSSFIIWIKKDVKGHFHQEHTENIVVIEGRAEMLFDGKRIIVKEGQYLNIPKGTTHSVTKVLTKKPLKVLSIQAPHFDGKDRVFTVD
jgi:mannose-6-phosphate isomerase-like protein (cupin superfamily)